MQCLHLLRSYVNTLQLFEIFIIKVSMPEINNQSISPSGEAVVMRF